MALVIADRVRESTTTTGTGTITLAGAVAGFQSFSVIGNGNTTYYAISDSVAGTWEVGIGTYTSAGTTLARNTVLESSNAGALVNFAAGTKDVFCTQPAERAVYVVGTDVVASNSATVPVTTGGTGATTAATARTNLGATTVGGNLFTLTNPSAITFPRFNADNSVSSLDAATFRTAIGAGAGTVTSVAVSGGTTGLTTSGGPITSSGTVTLAGTLALTNGGTGKTTAPAAMANLMGYTTTATAAGTTTLTNTSSYYQIFTGATTQTITLPVTSTLQTGWTFHICNNSTGNLTVNSSGANLVITVIPGTTVMVTCIGTALTTAADWEAGYTDFSTITGTGANVMATSPTLVTPALGTPTSGNFSTGTFTWPTFNQSTTGSAATLTTARTINGTSFNGSANITVPVSTTQKSDNVAYQVPFVTSVTAGNQNLYTDSAANFTYNPSTNTLTATTFSGTSTFATSANTAGTAQSLTFAGPASVTTSSSTLPSLTTGMALVISNTGSSLANFEAVVKQVTSSDSFLTITETSPGIWDLTEGSGPAANDFFTVQSSALANLATTLALPGPWTSTPTGSSGNVYIGASSTFGGSSWATGLSGPAWGLAGSYGGWSSTNSAYRADYANWSSVTDPATTWSSAPSNGFVFSYLQYPPQSSNTSSYDVWGNIVGGWNSNSGNSFSYSSGFSGGSNRVYYLVLMVSGNNTITVNGALINASVTTAYDSWSNTTYAFFRCTDNTSVGNLLSGTTAVSWSLFNSYYGHAWYEYT